MFLSPRVSPPSPAEKLRAAISDPLPHLARRITGMHFCPPPLEVGRSSDRLGTVMRGVCQYGLADDEFSRMLRRILHDDRRLSDESTEARSNHCASESASGRFSLPSELRDEDCIQEIIDELVCEDANEVAAYGSRADPAQDAFLRPLPRRGRDYDDVWRETDFLESSSKARKELRPVADWSELLNGYCDSHDGYYRDWSVSHQQLFKTAYPPPPPPVHIQHPACWGRRSDKTVSPEVSHPASSSESIVPPPGALSSSDLDDLGIEYERLQFMLLRQELLNYLRLRRLSSLVRSDAMLHPIKERCQRLQQNLVHIHGSILNAERPARQRTHDARAAVPPLNTYNETNLPRAT